MHHILSRSSFGRPPDHRYKRDCRKTFVDGGDSLTKLFFLGLGQEWVMFFLLLFCPMVLISVVCPVTSAWLGISVVGDLFHVVNHAIEHPLDVDFDLAS